MSGKAGKPKNKEGPPTKSSPEEPKPFVRKDRTKSREGMKKMGGGHKGHWKQGEIMGEDTHVDEGDPNFDSEDEDNIVYISAGSPLRESKKDGSWRDKALRELSRMEAPSMDLSLFKKKIEDIIEEYFLSEDAEEVARSVDELSCRAFHYELVKRAITMSMDRRVKEKELVSRLISKLYEIPCRSAAEGSASESSQNILGSADIAKGFERLFELAPDLQIDAPSAESDISTFLTRAVVDEVVPPSFLADQHVSRLGGSIVEEAKLKLSAKHATSSIEKSWGPGDGRPVDEMKAAIDDLVQEYLLSRDLQEAERCVRELCAPFFHHEVVKRAIVHSLDKDEQTRKAMSSLLAYLVSAKELVTQQQVAKGFDRLYEGLEDLKLDVPTAESVLDDFVKSAKSDDCLPASYEKKVASGQKE